MPFPDEGLEGVPQPDNRLGRLGIGNLFVEVSDLLDQPLEISERQVERQDRLPERCLCIPLVNGG